MNTFFSIMKWILIVTAASWLFTLGSKFMNQKDDLLFYIGFLMNTVIGVGLLVLVWESLQKNKTSKTKNKKTNEN